MSQTVGQVKYIPADVALLQSQLRIRLLTGSFSHFCLTFWGTCRIPVAVSKVQTFIVGHVSKDADEDFSGVCWNLGVHFLATPVSFFHCSSRASDNAFPQYFATAEFSVSERTATEKLVVCSMRCRQACASHSKYHKDHLALNLFYLPNKKRARGAPQKRTCCAPAPACPSAQPHHLSGLGGHSGPGWYLQAIAASLACPDTEIKSHLLL